ncbi:MAG: hypothetical protein ACLP8S_14975 [Solirubrobacteraceae bacterium]
MVTVLTIVVGIVIAVVALTELGHRARRPATAAAVPGRQQLIDVLAVLRRPQTKADLDPRLLSWLERTRPGEALRGTPDRPLIRLATVTPWGEKVLLVPMKPPMPSAGGAAEREFPAGRLPGILAGRTDEETLGVFTMTDGGRTGRSTVLHRADRGDLVRHRRPSAQTCREPDRRQPHRPYP